MVCFFWLLIPLDPIFQNKCVVVFVIILLDFYNCLILFAFVAFCFLCLFFRVDLFFVFWHLYWRLVIVSVFLMLLFFFNVSSILTLSILWCLFRCFSFLYCLDSFWNVWIVFVLVFFDMCLNLWETLFFFARIANFGSNPLRRTPGFC